MFNRHSQEDLNDLRWNVNCIRIDASGCFNALILLCDKLDEVNGNLKAVLERLPEKPERQPPQQ